MATKKTPVTHTKKSVAPPMRPVVTSKKPSVTPQKAAPSFARERSSTTTMRAPSTRAVASVAPATPAPTWKISNALQDERRRFPRVQKDLPIRLFAGRDKSPSLECTLRSEDMSLSGIFLRSTFYLPEDMPVRIELLAPWGQLASVRGVVARVVRSGQVTGFGIHFSDLDADALTDLVCIFVGDHIQQFVADFASRQKGSVDTTVLSEALLAWELARLRSLAP
jgi:hypothetical protein